MNSEPSIISDIAHINPEMTNSSWKGREIAYIDIASIGCGVYNSKPKILSYDDAPSRARRVVEHGDILISMVRPNRRSMIQISNPIDNTVASTGFALLRPKRIEDSDYLFGIISDPHFTIELEMLAYGAAYPAISTKDLCSVPIYLPSEKHRDEISGILRPISQLLSMNLDSIIERKVDAIFRAWFVDFDLSDTLHNSKIGPIPEGWSTKFLTEIAEIDRGFSYTSEYLCEKEEGTTMINLATFLHGGGYKDSGLKHISANFDSRYLINRGDVLIATVDLTPELRVVGSPLIVPSHLEKKCIFSQDLLRLNLKQDTSIGRGYLYHWLKVRRGILKQWSSGSTVSRFPQKALNSYPILIPPTELLEKFEAIFEQSLRVVESHRRRNQQLLGLKNKLLNQLMSGHLQNLSLKHREDLA